jgi:tRNA A-37 threonylcarbamoyl transferase component Bud32
MRFDFYRVDERWLSANHVSIEQVCQAASELFERAREMTLARSEVDNTAFPRLLKKMRRFSCQSSPGGKTVFLKLYLFSRLRDRLLLHLGNSKAIKAYAAAIRLNTLGIPCPAPITLLRSSNPLALILVTEALQEGTTLSLRVREVLSRGPASAPLSDWSGLIDQLAAFVARLHQQGIYHSDLHHSNLWVKALGGGEVAFYLLDVEEIAFCKRVSRRKRLENLLHLTRNFGTAAARAQLDGVALGLHWAKAYQEAAGIRISAETLKKVEAAARRGIQIWGEEAGRAKAADGD